MPTSRSLGNLAESDSVIRAVGFHSDGCLASRRAGQMDAVVLDDPTRASSRKVIVSSGSFGNSGLIGLQSRDASLEVIEVMSVRKAMGKFAHVQQQKRGAALLLVGAISGFCAFATSTIIGLYDYYGKPIGMNYMGRPFASGENYLPQTFSEMVHDPMSPQGKGFFAFCLIGSVCMLMSWYPLVLRNVYTGDDRLVSRRGPLWVHFRQFLPPIGMMLVACIPVTPPVNRDFGEQLAISFHTAGAVLTIGGYCLSELHILFSGKAFLVFKPGERAQRICLVALTLFSGVVFEVCGAIASRMLRAECADVWRVPTVEELKLLQGTPASESLAVTVAEAIRLNHKLLYDTAFGSCQLVKAGEFWFEVLAGVFMVLSLMVIWYHCPERHIDLDESLPALSKIEMRELGYDEEYVQYGFGSSPGSSDKDSDRGSEYSFMDEEESDR